MASNLQNFRLTCGEDVTLSMTARSKTGAILAITGGTITWRMSSKPTTSKGSVSVLSKTGVIVSGAAGTFTVTLSDTDTSPTTLRNRQYWHQAIIEVSGTTTIAVQGKVTVEGGITST